MYVCDDISVCRRRVCMCVMIFQCVGGVCNVCDDIFMCRRRVVLLNDNFPVCRGECVCVG